MGKVNNDKKVDHSSEKIYYFLIGFDAVNNQWFFPAYIESKIFEDGTFFNKGQWEEYPYKSEIDNKINDAITDQLNYWKDMANNQIALNFDNWVDQDYKEIYKRLESDSPELSKEQIEHLKKLKELGIQPNPEYWGVDL